MNVEKVKTIHAFSSQLNELLDEFVIVMGEKYSKKTVRKHASIIELFIIFLTEYSNVDCFDNITKGMVNSKFKVWWRRKVWDSSTEADIRVALKKFFYFLSKYKNISVNQSIKSVLK